jgi:hypothetical protein
MFADIFGYLLGRLTLAIALDHQRDKLLGRGRHELGLPTIRRAHVDMVH